MKSFPMFLRTSGRRIVIAGGGEAAAQKARLVLKTDAQILLAAPELDAELAGLVARGEALHHPGPLDAASFEQAALTFIATGCPGADMALHGVAKAHGALVNVVDRPDLCDATTPSIVDRDPVVVAIGTEGTAPVLARSLKTRIETLLPGRIGALAALAGRLRGAVAQKIPARDRRAFWAWVFKGEVARLFAAGEETAGARLLKSALETGATPGAGSGRIALVGAGPGAADLLTLRAVEHLQEADVIFYDRLVDPEVLELARRDSERIYVGKHPGAHALPQDRINAQVVAEARKGRRVVRLKSGDPSIFGRAGEECAAACAAGLPVEIIPGITAASAAAARLGRGLTERGETDTLVLTTGRCQPGDPAPDWARHLHPGTTLVFYMSTGAADQITTNLLAHGAAPDTKVDIAARVGKPGERLLSTPLAPKPNA
ncbi:MAG: siroheme synthase CysG [Silicimonas sp.]|nr:siroheme synthase CysG [Silicimonas sp.]